MKKSFCSLTKLKKDQISLQTKLSSEDEVFDNKHFKFENTSNKSVQHSESVNKVTFDSKNQVDEEDLLKASSNKYLLRLIKDLQNENKTLQRELILYKQENQDLAKKYQEIKLKFKSQKSQMKNLSFELQKAKKIRSPSLFKNISFPEEDFGVRRKSLPKRVLNKRETSMSHFSIRTPTPKLSEHSKELLSTLQHKRLFLKKKIDEGNSSPKKFYIRYSKYKENKT